MLGRAIVWFITLAVAACSSQQQLVVQKQPRPLIPLMLGASRQLNQQVTVQYRDELWDLIGVSLIGSEEFRVSLLTVQGFSLMDIEYDGHKVQAQQYIDAGSQIPPQALLADMQLIYWPLEALQQSLPEPWRIQEKSSGGSRLRELLLDDNLYTEVRYSTDDIWQAEVYLEQKLIGYTLKIKNF
ncbi:DUF3261 domain-containing protein [Microbulbifer discodermiae]|uniref:DUF3261 domain-containing protein n=1 Tax=Microbulbifer sp. 2201CG32-9 TaxID=3232309 RepID=UPI00345BD538